MAFSKKIFIMLLCASSIISTIVFRLETLSKEERLANVLVLYAERISYEMERAVYVTDVLKEITRAGRGNLSLVDFNSLASAVGEGVNYIALQYMKDGIVQYVFPLEGNEATIGHNVLMDDSTVVEARMAMDEKKITISGPFDLLQGMKGLAIRNPLYLDGENGEYFWGFITIVLPVPDSLMNTGLFELEEIGYEFQLIAKYKNEDIVFAATEEFDKKFSSHAPVIIGENTWTLSMYIGDDVAETWIYIILLTLALILFSIIIYIVVMRVERRLNNDLLTGAFNRRFLEKYIKQRHITKGLTFTLLYIDLNDFKPVNDNYGHEMGDLLLIAFVKRIQSNIKSDGAIYRIGGDEFVIIIPQIQKKDAIHKITNRIVELAKTPFVIAGEKILISASVGKAAFPEEGTDIRTLLQVADERMYNDKQEYKKGKPQAVR